MVYSLDVEEDVGLLVENRPDVADRHRGVVHLIPLPIACLGDTTEESAGFNIFAKQNHHCDTSSNPIFFLFSVSELALKVKKC